MADTLSAGDRQEPFRRKKRRYLISASLKGTEGYDYFSPDMAAEVKSLYEEEKGTSFRYLSGNEFRDTPPGASGLGSFARSVAGMMRVSDKLDPEKDASVRKTVRELIKLYFEACGEDEKGAAVAKERRKAAAAEFLSKRGEYEKLVREEKRREGIRLMEELRDQNGLSERIKSGLPGEDPEFERIADSYAGGDSAVQKEIESLRRISRETVSEAQERIAGRDALRKAVRSACRDRQTEAAKKELLGDAYDEHSHEVSLKLRELLYRKQAALYQLKWLVNGTPVDEMIAPEIAKISSVKADILDGDLRLCEVPGFVEPVEKEEIKIEDTGDHAAVFELGREISAYLSSHPFQFEAHCLTSIISDNDELTDILAKAWTLVRRIDEITMWESLSDMDPDKANELFDIWFKADMLCKSGYTVTELVLENMNRTVSEATQIFSEADAIISYSALEREARQDLVRVFKERSGFFVSE